MATDKLSHPVTNREPGDDDSDDSEPDDDYSVGATTLLDVGATLVTTGNARGSDTRVHIKTDPAIANDDEPCQYIRKLRDGGREIEHPAALPLTWKVCPACARHLKAGNIDGVPAADERPDEWPDEGDSGAGGETA